MQEEMLDARDGRKRKAKRTPKPPENQGETTRKTRQGEPHQPRTEKKAPLGQERFQSGNPTKTSTRDEKNHPPRPPTPTRQETRKHRTGNERRRRKKEKRKKKKTQVRERCLGECEEEDVRVDVGELVQDAETQGEPQTKKVWGSPAPERERKEKKKTSPTKRTRQKKKTDANKHLIRAGS